MDVGEAITGQIRADDVVNFTLPERGRTVRPQESSDLSSRTNGPIADARREQGLLKSRLCRLCADWARVGASAST